VEAIGRHHVGFGAQSNVVAIRYRKANKPSTRANTLLVALDGLDHLR